VSAHPVSMSLVSELWKAAALNVWQSVRVPTAKASCEYAEVSMVQEAAQQEAALLKERPAQHYSKCFATTSNHNLNRWHTT